MGTRNLTMVISDGKTKVAQYGQWDGYPSGQGKTALEFLFSTDIDHFKQVLKKVRFATKKDDKEKQTFLNSIGSKDGWLTMEQSAKYNEKYKYDSRDHGADILQMIMDSNDKEIVLTDSSDFAADSLFCEYAYVIDLDKNTFEIYSGFNQKPVKSTERFAHLSHDPAQRKEKYFPVRLLKTYKLNKLPSVEQFLSYFKKKEEA